MSIIDKLHNSYNSIMYKENESKLLPCCLAKIITYTFFITSVFLFFTGGRCFESGYYGSFAWYVMGGCIAYGIYWMSLKHMCWVQLRNENVAHYNECCIKRHFVNAEELSND